MPYLQQALALICFGGACHSLGMLAVTEEMSAAATNACTTVEEQRFSAA
jgi:hypothetical protein